MTSASGISHLKVLGLQLTDTTMQSCQLCRAHWQNAAEMPEANYSASTLSFHQLREATRLSQIRKSSPGLNTACQWPLILWFSRSIFYSAGTIRWQWGNGQCRVGFQWRGRPATVQYMPWLWDERIIFRWYERCVHTYIELMVWN